MQHAVIQFSLDFFFFFFLIANVKYSRMCNLGCSLQPSLWQDLKDRWSLSYGICSPPDNADYHLEVDGLIFIICWLYAFSV